MESAAPEGAPRAGLGWAAAATGAAAIELTLALLARTLARDGLCLGEGGPFSCAALLRPRLGALGPASVSDLAVVGAALTLALALRALLTRPGPPRLEAGSAAVPAAGVGLALGLQLLLVTAAGRLCLLCLAVLGSAGAAAVTLALTARRRGAGLRAPALAFLAALVLSAPLAAWRGAALAGEDAERRAAVLAAGGEAGPELVLVSREGCPFCEVLLLDVLAEPPLFERLQRTRGLRIVPPTDPLARAHAGRGVPWLLAFGPDGRLQGRLAGAQGIEAVARWLEGLGASADAVPGGR